MPPTRRRGRTSCPTEAREGGAATNGGGQQGREAEDADKDLGAHRESARGMRTG